MATTTVRKISFSIAASRRWKIGAAATLPLLLGTCAPLPGVFDQIKILGELRVVTRIGPLAFYRDPDGVPQGPEYELAQRFADELGVRLKITPLRSYAEIYGALRSGRAHLAAAALKVPVTAVDGVAFGPTYQRVREHLVFRRGALRPNSLADIGNGDLEIAANSSQARLLIAARSAIPDLPWTENRSTDSQALLEGVANGSIDYTIVDSTEFALAHDEHPDLRIAFDFPPAASLWHGPPADTIRNSCSTSPGISHA